MSVNDYYSNPKQENHSETTDETWNGWSTDQQYRSSPNYQYHTNTLNQQNHSGHLNSAQGNRFIPYANQRQFYRGRFLNPYYQYDTTPPPPPPPYGWQRYNYKRNRPDGTEGDYLKTNRKRKKPFSQVVPTKKDWTSEEAECALATEKAYNKKSKNALIIKFPDHELNKEIISQFHTSIESVHFQQPCTPRFCFVTLQESADPDEVIEVLNKHKFGEGHLTVEYKKDREEDQVVSPDDIDPLTLYVGNLAQDVTKDDMVNMYPSSKRIDIGFAKKMKFTRYAFIGFKTAAESLDAFKRTHSKQLHSKSLIVRFRRLHGTIGMPGEVKPQNPPKNKSDAVETTTSIETANSAEPSTGEIMHDLPDSLGVVNTSTEEIPIPCDVVIKQEPGTSSTSSSDKDKDQDDLRKRWVPPPKVIPESDVNIKKETDAPSIDIKKIGTVSDIVTIKPEPLDPELEMDINQLYCNNVEMKVEKLDDDDLFADMNNFERIYDSLMSHKHNISVLNPSRDADTDV